MEAVRAWASDPKHIEAKQKGKSTWYRYYHSVIAEVKSLHLHSLGGH
jgi:heme-degrading monooxygenase HmoA